MKVTLLTVVVLTAAAFANAADPECVYRKLRGLTTHWPNPATCSSYYRCTNKNVVRSVKCAAGKEYNPKNGKCASAGRGLCRLSLVKPFADEANVCVDEVSGAFLPKSGYCGEYYICNNKEAYPQYCDLGSYFDVLSNNCLPDKNTTCWQNVCQNQEDGTTQINQAACASYYVCLNQQATSQSCPVGSYFDTKLYACTPDVGYTHCWENFCIDKPDGMAVADSQVCGSTFYICLQQKATAQSCPEGSYFHAESLNCVPGVCPDDTSSTTECDDETTTEACEVETTTEYCEDETTTTTEYCADETTTTTEACDDDQNISTVTPPGGCGNNINNGDVVEDKENCRLYYVCVNGNLISHDCLTGNYFNADLGACVPDTNNECTPDDDQNTSTVTPPGGCGNNINNGDIVEDKENCRLYYICINGDLVSHDCLTGNYFNADLGACVPDTNNECTPDDQKTTASDDDQNISTVTPPGSCGDNINNGDIVEDKENCRLYYICINGDMTSHDCLTGNYFNADLEACVPDTNNVCPTSRQLFWECYEHQRAAIAEDCWHYQSCSAGRWQEVACARGQYYDAALGDCIEDIFDTCPENQALKERSKRSVDVDDCSCPDGIAENSMVAHPTDCDKYLICQNQTLVEGSCGPGNVFSNCTGVCVPDTEFTCWVCGNKPNGYLVANPDECNSYYTCYNGLGIETTCAEGEYFNYESCAIDVTGSCVNPCSCSDAAVVAHPICTKYYQCTNGVPKVVNCPLGLGFDASSGKCTMQVACSATLCAGASDGTTLPVEGYNTRFYVCLNHQASIRSCIEDHIYNSTLGICLPQPSPDCDQTKCKAANINVAYPSTNCDNTSFCLCQNDGAYLKHCELGYYFNEALNICTFTGPCNPEVCLSNPEYYVSIDYEDPNSFCLCRAQQPISVPCPRGYTFNGEICVLVPIPDPRCCSTYCVDKSDYVNFPATNIDTGFCTCLKGVPEFNECPPNKVFNTTYLICMDQPIEDDTCDSCPCDASQCAALPNNEPFPAINTNEGFCICNDDKACYTSCLDDKIFNATMGICMVPENACISNACDVLMCDELSDYMPFEAKNGTAGFCYCLSGVPQYRACPNNTQYDVDIGICLDIEDTCGSSYCDEAQCDCLPEDQPFLSTKDDPAAFCYCKGGLAILDSCENGKIYNDATKICMLPQAPSTVCNAAQCAKQAENQPFAALNSTAGFCLCIGDVPYYEACGNNKTFNATENICMTVTAAIVPTKFVTCDAARCSQTVPYKPFAAANTRFGFCLCDAASGAVTYHNCEQGYSFDASLDICIREVEHHMERRSVEAEQNPLCVNGFKRSVPANCSQYELCMDGSWKRRTCAHQKYYNPEQQQCLEPRDDTICRYAKVAGLPPCTNRTESQTLSSKNNNCLEYFRCAQQKWRLRSCPKAHYYARHMRTCIAAKQNADMQHICEKELSNRFEPTRHQVQTCKHTSVQATTKGCAHYLMCLENVWWYQQCPLGMYFSQEHNYCMPNDQGQCADVPTNQTTQLTACTNGLRRAVVINCSAYEECQGGKWLRKGCLAGQQFDELLNLCVPSDSSCQVSGLRRACQLGEMRSFPLSSNCTQFYYCEAELWHVASCLKGHTYASEVSACVPHAADNPCLPVWQQAHQQVSKQIDVDETICRDLDDGVAVPHADDCTRFYLCHNQQATMVQSCALGSFFDAGLGYCRPNDGSCAVPLAGVCAELSDGSLVAHVENCRAYYSCSSINGTQLHYCALAEYYNNTAGQCQPDNGQCSTQQVAPKKCDGLLHGARIAHELYCNIYYACVRGLAMPVECPEHYYFSGGECVYDALQQCQNGQLVDSNNNNTLYSCQSLKDGTYLADLNDCTRYYICSEGLAVPQHCSDVTYFDAEQLLCVPDDGSCPYINQNNNTHVPPDPSVCEGRHGNIMSDTANCNNFYICVSGKLRHERCYTDYYFNMTIEQCQLLNNTNSSQIMDVENKFFNGSLKLVRAAQSTVLACNDKPTEFADICPKIGEGNSIAEQGDCRRYISCENDEPVSQRCRNGEGFDSLLGICRQNDGTCSMENGERVGICSGKHGQLARDVDNCRGYFVCVHGQKIEGMCEMGDYFSKVTNTCEKDVLKECSTTEILEKTAETLGP